MCARAPVVVYQVCSRGLDSYCLRVAVMAKMF